MLSSYTIAVMFDNSGWKGPEHAGGSDKKARLLVHDGAQELMCMLGNR